jgi:hypothetical protein
MDADVMITIAFCLEVFLFGLAAAIFIAREARKGGAEVGPASATVRPANAGRRVSAGARGADRGMHS